MAAQDRQVSLLSPNSVKRKPMAIIDLGSAGFVANRGTQAELDSTDNSDKWNEIIPNAAPGTVLQLPFGYMAFHKPIAALPNEVTLKGCDAGYSSLVRCFNQADGDIFLTTGQFDCTVQNVIIFAANGTQGGFAIGRRAVDVNTAPFRTVLNGVETSRYDTGRFYGGIIFDGVLGPEHYGARRIQMNNIIVSGAATVGLWLGGVNHVSGSNIGLGAGNPTYGLWILGDDRNRSNLVHLSGPMDCSVLFYSTSCCMISAGALGKVTTDGNSSNNTFNTSFLREAPVLYGLNNMVVCTDKTYKSR